MSVAILNSHLEVLGFSNDSALKSPAIIEMYRTFLATSSRPANSEHPSAPDFNRFARFVENPTEIYATEESSASDNILRKVETLSGTEIGATKRLL